MGDGVAVDGSGWHCELVAASAASEAVRADAAGIPGVPLTRLQARQPPDSKQAPSARLGADCIRTAPSRLAGKSLVNGA